jgi:3-hydroxymyristoyl/3-hydroxydecanoyl-(acyl carrier protein) dehydratase
VPTGPIGPVGFVVNECRHDGDETTFAIVVEEDCPHCDDHFPGDPIVPAIAQLDLVSCLAQQIVAGIAPASIDSLRLSGAVRPDDHLTVHMTGVTRGGKSRFRIAREDDLLTEGTIAWAGVTTE